MDIVAHLAALLKDKNEIGLEGIGTFSRKKQPGKYDIEAGNFTPPKYSLEFSEEVANTNVLRDYLMENYSLTEDAAVSAINDWSEQLLERLSKHEIVILKNIGELNWQHGHVLFTPDADVDLGNAFFGYPLVKDIPTETASISLDETAVDNQFADESPTASNTQNLEVFEHMEEDIAQPSPLTQKFDAEEIEVADLSSRNETIDYTPEVEQDSLLPEEEYGAKRPTYFRWIIILFLIVVGIGVLYMAKPDLFDRFKTINKQEPFDADSLKSNADTISNDSTLINAVATAVKDSVSNASLTDTDTYEIIVTAVKSEKEIEQLSERYNKMGFEAKVIPGKILKKISVATFTNEKEARDSLKSVQEKLKNKEIYIYYNKHK